MTFPEGYKIYIQGISRVSLKIDVEIYVKYLEYEASVQVRVLIRRLLHYYRCSIMI